MAIVNIDNRYSTTLAMISGVMITATRLAIPQFYPSQATNGWANLFAELSSGGLTLFALLAGTISFLVQFGGVSIFIGGLLCYKKHLRSGKEFVGIGTTFGFADLLLAIPSLGSSSSGPIYLVVVAWTGLLFAVFAGRHIKGPKGSYASEVKKLVTGIRSRLNRQEKRKRRERRLRRRRARSKLPRGNLPSAKQYNVGGNKNSESQTSR